MEPEFNQLKHREHQESSARSDQTKQAASVEFPTVEDAIRADRERASIPSELEHRVAEAIRREAATPSSWWDKLFRRKQQ